MLLVASFCSLHFLEMKMKFSNSLFIEKPQLHILPFLNETTITGKKHISEGFERSLLTCPVQVYDSMETRRLTWENIRRTGADAKLVTSLPHSLLLSLSLLFTSLFVLICLHLSSVCVIFHVAVSCPFSSTYLLCLSVCSSRPHLFYPWLSLSGFFSLCFSADCLHIHSFMLACSLMVVAGVLPGACRERPGLRL